ncbi:hypothetical protein HK100_007941 [Physocladia obscura]|uniref:Uncharacterized protein n=1 Tax=Physocladia obscura TaxID=109957 RepID=A0AAD5T518_9FUNG|nr:hypothetical protein HK100_007941 [Physocladia obscura]
MLSLELERVSNKRKISTSLNNVYAGTLASTLTGATGGAAWGIVRGYGPVGYSFLMGTNWLCLSLPFFVIRESVLQHRSKLNSAYGRENWRHRDSDDMLASLVGGAVVGSGLAYYTRNELLSTLDSGSFAVTGGGILCAGVFGVLQFGATKLRHARQEAGAARKQRELDVIAGNDDSQQQQSLGKLLKNPPPRDEIFDERGWDPLNDFTKYLRGRAVNTFDENFVSWASPVINALDLDYRNRLNAKIAILERQIASLNSQLEKVAEKEKQS